MKNLGIRITHIREKVKDCDCSLREIKLGKCQHQPKWVDARHALREAMSDLHFPAPKKNFSSKARFYFTELGWEKFSKKILNHEYMSSVEFTIQKRKIEKSQIMYCDEYQFAAIHK